MMELSGPQISTTSEPDDVTLRRRMTPQLAQQCVTRCRVLRIMCFPVVKGRLRHLFLSSRELKQYLNRARPLLQRYAHRMQWLLSGQHFHTIYIPLYKKSSVGIYPLLQSLFQGPNDVTEISYHDPRRLLPYITIHRFSF